jgi:hypothetical protein
VFNPTKFAAAIALAASLTGMSAFAAPAQPFAATDTINSTVSVAYNDSTDTSVRFDASKLFDSSQLIKLDYGFMSLDQALRIKQVNAPEGVTVSIDDSSLAMQNNTSTVTLDLVVANSAQYFGQYPIEVILENTMTGQTTTLKLVMTTN